MSEFLEHVKTVLTIDPESTTGLRWSKKALRYVAGKEAGRFHQRAGFVVQVLGATYLCGDIIKMIRDGADINQVHVSDASAPRCRSGLKGVKIIKKAKNGGVTGYLPRIKRKDFSWTGDIQTDKRVAAAMVDAKLIEVDGAKAVTNKSLGLI